MKSAPAITAALLAFLGLGLATVALGDVLVVAGQRAECREGFVVVGEEVYAPLLPALRHLGASYQLTPDGINITTARRREIVIPRNGTQATLDGMIRELPGPPRQTDSTYLLPARTVGSLLGCAVRWDAASRTLFMHPWVRRFTLETLPDRYRLTVGSEARIAFRTGKVEDPPRFYMDLLDADLASIPSEIRLDGSYLKAARVRQNTLAPAPEGDVVRVVVDLAEWKPYRVQATADRCAVQVDFPLPGAEEVPPETPPVVLTDLAFRRLSPRVVAVKLSTFGKAGCTSGATEQPPSVWVEVANAESRLTTRHIEARDRLVSDISCDPVAGKSGVQRLTINLTEPAPHRVVSESGEVQVLLGRIELANVCIVVDAGHGEHDTGAVGRTGLQEKDVNLDIALRVQDLLQAMGARVLMTRTTDSHLLPWGPGDREGQRRDLLARCALANDTGADVFVSIHANARDDNPSGTRGTETYYRKSDSIAFAQVMQEEVVRAVGLPDGGVIRHPKSIIVLYQTNMPAVLVEVAYLSHPDDEAQLATSEFRQRAAEGIANGIKRFVEEGGLLPGLPERETSTEQRTPTEAGSE